MDKDDKAPEEERESYNQGVKGFLKYFERNYIGEIGGEGRKEPMFKKNYLSKTRGFWKILTVFWIITPVKASTRDLLRLSRNLHPLGESSTSSYRKKLLPTTKSAMLLREILECQT